MTQPLPEPVFVILCDEEVSGRIVVESEAFTRFVERLEASLTELEAKWSHWVPPQMRPRTGPRFDQTRG